MKILYPIHFITSVGADRWMGNGYKDAFEDLGHEVFWIQSADRIKEKIEEFSPDIIFLGMERLKKTDVPILNSFRKKGGKVVVFVNSVFDENSECFKVIKEDNIADIYRGETEMAWMKEFEEKSGKRYFLTPNAAHERLHFPVDSVKKYACDIVFLGANLPLKKDLFEELLFPLQKKYDVKLYGPGWTTKDNVLRAVGYGARRIGLSAINDWVSEKRITVLPAEENQLYSSAKICINLHEVRKAWNINHVILNERTFKIPACGGFELMDFVQPEEVLRRYFTEDEMVSAKDTKDWFNKIDYYMIHDKEREDIRIEGTKRALKDHYYTNRAMAILQKLSL